MSFSPYFARRLSVLLISASVFLPAENPSALGEDMDKDWMKVESFVERKNYPAAERAIEGYVRKHPKSEAAYIEGGRIARKYNLPDMGLRIIGSGLENFPSDATLTRMKAELVMEQGDLFSAKIILSELSRKIAFRERKGLLSEIEDQTSDKSDRSESSPSKSTGKNSRERSSPSGNRTRGGAEPIKGYAPLDRAMRAKEVNALIEEERKRSESFLKKKESDLNGISPYPSVSGESEALPDGQSQNNPSAETEKVIEDEKVLGELALTIPPLSTFDQNSNFQQIILPPSQSPKAYTLENDSVHLRLTNVDLLYSGGASIESGIAAESPLIWDTVHFQTGTNEYLGSASGQGTTLSSYSYAGIDGEGPDEIQFLLDAGNSNGEARNDAGLYTHVDVPVGPFLIDAQGWYQLPWSSYGQALLLGGLHSGSLITTTWSIVRRLSLSGAYEFTYDTLYGSQTPFGYNHNTLFTLDWEFLKTPDLNLVAGYDTQGFAALVPNPSFLVPVLQSSAFWSGGLSTLNQIGNFLVLNGQLGGIYGKFGTLGPMAGLQADGGLALQITPRFEFYGNVSYESLAASYIGPVVTMMYGINVWF